MKKLMTEFDRNKLAWIYFKLNYRIDSNSQKIQTTKSSILIEECRNENIKLSNVVNKIRTILNRYIKK